MSAEITRHGAEAIDELRPLWLAMVHHHVEVAPEGPARDDDDTWALRRAHYVSKLAEPGAFVLVARVNGRAVGYALVFPAGPSPTYAEPHRWAELDSLALLPEARGQGIGEALVERVQEEVGDTEIRLFALAGNTEAHRFYERLGFRTYLISMRRPR